MLAEQRYEKILDYLEANKTVMSSYLVEHFKVSSETVRRDLEMLEKKGLLKRIHGGATLDHFELKGRSRSVREQMNNSEKEEISVCCIQQLEENDVLAMDNGTTTIEVAKQLVFSIRKFTIITYSLIVADVLSKNDAITVILLGGVLDANDMLLNGPFTEEHLDKFNINTAIVSASGISLKEGVTDFDMKVLPLQKKMLAKANKRIILADSSKFGVASLVKICDLNEIECIVTDSNLKEAVKKRYLDKGINVINSEKESGDN